MHKFNHTGRKHERNKSDRGCVMYVCDVIQLKNKQNKIFKYKL